MRADSNDSTLNEDVKQQINSTTGLTQTLLTTQTCWTRCPSSIVATIDL